MPRAPKKPTSVHRPEHAVLAGLLRELRVAAGMTQRQAAHALGIAQTGISDLETGDRGMELLVVRDLTQIYGADWRSFIDELERRLESTMRPASELLRPATPECAK